MPQVLTTLLPTVLLILAVCYAIALAASKAEDPKTQLLNSLFRFAGGESAQYHHKRVA